MNLKPKYPVETSLQQATQTEFVIPAPSFAPFRTTFASMSMHSSDLLRLLNFPDSDIQALGTVIQSNYRKGIYKEQIYGQSHEFKLHGNPSYGQTSDALISRILIREILAQLFSMGWIFHASTEVSKKASDKDTLLLRKQQAPPPSADFLAISFNQYDWLRLIGAPSDLAQSISNLLSGMNLLQTDLGWKDQNLNAREFKLKDNPWSD